MTAGAIFFLAMLIYAAITFTTAGGNAEKTKKAQKILFSSIIGLVIVISAFLIVKIIEYVLQINLPI
jgi:heme A synthase